MPRTTISDVAVAEAGPGRRGSRSRPPAARPPRGRGRSCSRRTRRAPRRSARAGRSSCSASSSALEHPAGEDLLAAAADRPAVDRQRVAVLELLEQARARRVDDRMPARARSSGPGSGSGRSRSRDVDHGPHPGRDQLLGGDPVEVGVVDHRDVGRAQALDQVLGLAPQPRASRGSPSRSRRRCDATRAPEAAAACRWHGLRLGEPGSDRQRRRAGSRRRQHLAGVTAGGLVDAVARRPACGRSRRPARRRSTPLDAWPASGPAAICLLIAEVPRRPARRPAAGG